MVFFKVLVMGSTLWYKLATSFRGLFPENEVGQYTFCLPLPVITAPPSSSVLSVFGSEVLSFSCAWPLTPKHSNSVRDIKSKETSRLTLTLTSSLRLLCFLGQEVSLLYYLYCNRNLSVNQCCRRK